MNRLIRTELLKQRTTRPFLAGIVAAPVVASLLTIVILSLAGRQGNDPLSADTLVQIVGGPAGVITLMAVILGVLGMAGEYRHQTITTMFLATPCRRDVVVAKLVAHGLTGALMGSLSLAASIAIALPWLLARGVDPDLDGRTARVAVGLIVSAALYGALGVSVGALLRNQTIAATVVLLWLLAVEGIIADLSHATAITQWLPASAGRALVQVGPDRGGLSAPVAATVFTLYIGAFGAAATRLTVHQDIT